MGIISGPITVGKTLEDKRREVIKPLNDINAYSQGRPHFSPIEIASKVILRRANLSTSQRYLGKITDTEEIKWIENLYTKKN